MPEWVYRVCLPRLRFKKDGEMDKRSSGYRDLCKAGEWLAMAHVKQAELKAPYWDDENDCYIDAEPGSLG